MTSKYVERIILCDLTHMMSMVNFVNIDIKTSKIDRGFFYLEKEFFRFIYKKSLNGTILNS